MKNLLDTLQIIYKRKDEINELMYQKEVKYRVFDTSDQTRYDTLIKNYGQQIINLLNQCFGKLDDRQIYPNDGTWFLITKNGHVVAALMAKFHFGFLSWYPWIWNVCRDPNYKGKEIGKKLINYTLKWFSKYYPEYKEIYLYASQKPVSRTSYYESLGFKKTDYFDQENPEMVFIQQ